MLLWLIYFAKIHIMIFFNQILPDCSVATFYLADLESLLFYCLIMPLLGRFYDFVTSHIYESLQEYWSLLRSNQHSYSCKLTHFKPMFPFHTPEISRKPLKNIFDKPFRKPNGNIGLKWVNWLYLLFLWHADYLLNMSMTFIYEG